MAYRLLTVALITAGAMFATQSFAETTVKSSKSNTSDRMGGGGGGKGATQRATSLNSSRSNVDRMGGGGGGKGAAGITRGRMGGGGGKGAVQLNPQPEPPGRR